MSEGPPRGGIRGGRDRFSWQDVKEDHRHASHYLGASLKAPSGRWAANKDLEWFSKPGTSSAKSADEAGEKQAEARRAEIRRIKEAEADAVLRALGKPVPDRTPNANMEPLGESRQDVQVTSAEEKDTGERDKRHHCSSGSSRHHHRHSDRRRPGAKRSPSRSRSPQRRKHSRERSSRHADSRSSRRRRDSRDRPR